MDKINIEYGKMKQDGSRTVYIRLCINSTNKRMPTPYVLAKNEYKKYPDTTFQILTINHYKDFLL